MKVKALSIILCVLMFATVFAAAVPLNVSASPVIINVPADYPTIQQGIDAASAGDTVKVAAGIFLESINLKNGVIVEGAGAAVTTIDSLGVTHVVTAADGSTIKGFTITGGHEGIYSLKNSITILDNTIKNNQDTGISLDDASAVIKNNEIINNGGRGIYIDHGSPVIIKKNVIDNNGDDGVQLTGGSSATISCNIVRNHDYTGLNCEDDISSATISNNLIENNPFGIYANWCPAVITGNTITGSTEIGILGEWTFPTISGNSIDGNEIGISLVDSSGSLIYHNNFIDNTVQAEDDDPGSNDWHNPLLEEGNYWSDYAGLDDGSGSGKHAIADDGIGDTAIPYPTTDFDFYPLMEPVVINDAPEISTIDALTNPVPVDTVVNMKGKFIDSNCGDTHTAEWDWGDEDITSGSVEGRTATGTHEYTEPGIYTIELTITDNYDESSKMTYQYLVVYDSSDGFVTGGGWIESPEGAYKADETLTGKANFGFVSKYKKGASVPEGNTHFKFNAGELNFQSSSYDWLVIAGAKAMFKGMGTVNGEEGYGFMISAVDANLAENTDTDLFRIKIWDKSSNEIVYDNNVEDPTSTEASTELSGGSIVVHKAK